MKKLKLLAVASAVAAAATLAGPGPVHASGNDQTAFVFTGTLTLGQGLSSGATVTLSGTGPCGTAAGGAGTCNVNLTGTARGLCAAWTGTASGHLLPGLVLTSGPSYSLNVSLINGGGVVAITGTARNSAGVVRQVAGSVALSGSESLCTNGPAAYDAAGELSIV